MIDIVMTARDMGVYTIVVDKDCSSPAKRFADKSFDISTNDIDILEQLCKAEHVDGVFTGFEDFNIHIACELCQRLDLPFYATCKQLELITNKTKFKNECRRYGVPIIEQYTLQDAINMGKYPYIVKPVDSYGSRGITVCRNKEELRSGYEKAESVSLSGAAIIERFIDHDYGVELFYTVVNGNIYLTVSADRYTVRNGETTVPLPVAEVFPSQHSAQIREKLDGSIREMLSGLKIQNGLVLIQALYDGNGNYFVYEMAYRLTGEQHYRLIREQYGVDLAKMMICVALGEDISQYDTILLDEAYFDKPSINLAILLNTGKVKHITGLDRVYKINEVISYNLTHKSGDEIKPSGDYSHMLIRINMVAEDYQKLCRAVELVNEYVSVISVNGEDMLAVRFYLPNGSA